MSQTPSLQRKPGSSFCESKEPYKRLDSGFRRNSDVGLLEKAPISTGQVVTKKGGNYGQKDHGCR